MKNENKKEIEGFIKRLNELEDSIYTYHGNIRDQMNMHFFRFVELETQFNKINSEISDISLKLQLIVKENKIKSNTHH